jgi:hypothetical protein
MSNVLGVHACCCCCCLFDWYKIFWLETYTKLMTNKIPNDTILLLRFLGRDFFLSWLDKERKIMTRSPSCSCRGLSLALIVLPLLLTIRSSSLLLLLPFCEVGVWCKWRVGGGGTSCRCCLFLPSIRNYRCHSDVACSTKDNYSNDPNCRRRITTGTGLFLWWRFLLFTCCRRPQQQWRRQQLTTPSWQGG